MKALSIRQPWAGLIVAGIKNIENRSWMTKYQGPLVIVSTKTPEKPDVWRVVRAKVKELGLAFPESLCNCDGYALGVVDFRHVVYLADDGEIETDHPHLTTAIYQTWWERDSVGFILEHPRRLPHPLPVRGALGLYTLPAEVAAKIKT
jgi:hypothetical protein